MPKKVTNGSNGEVGLGEVGTIKEILFGDQMRTYENEFAKLSDQISQLQSSITSMEKTYLSSKATMENDFLQRMSTLESLIENRSRDLEAKILKISEHDRKKMGKLFEGISKKLLQD